MGLTDRTIYLPGDIFAVDLGGPYDLVVASNIFHMWSQERGQELLGRLAGTLAADGRIADTGLQLLQVAGLPGFGRTVIAGRA